jgi:hypothetical protein
MNQPAPSCPLSDYFLSSVTWVTDERVAVQWLNRRQNHVHVQIYDSEGDRWREGQVGTSGRHLIPVGNQWGSLNTSGEPVTFTKYHEPVMFIKYHDPLMFINIRGTSDIY